MPSDGGALIVSNHSGALPPDAPMIMQAIRHEHPSPRPVYMLGEHWFKGYPGVGMLANKIGLVAAHPANAQRLLRDERRLALVFPEGQKGSRKVFWQRYRLRRFGRGGFVRTAIRAGVPIVPVAVVGAEEAMPIFAHVPLLQRLTGLIYFPVNLAFPHFGMAAGLCTCRRSSGSASSSPSTCPATGPRTPTTWRLSRARRGHSRPSAGRARPARTGARVGLVRVGSPDVGTRVRLLVTTAAAAALLIAGCGDDDFENDPRPPVPVALTGVIQDDKVTVSPDEIGAGPILITISNQTDDPHTITLEGAEITEQVGPVDPLDTATIQRTLAPGSYEVRAGSERAVQEEIAPAVLAIGRGARPLEQRPAAALATDPLAAAVTVLSLAGRFQAVIATAFGIFSAGVFQSSVCRGRRLSWAATRSSSTWLCAARSVPLGKYWRSSPLVFSLEPRCQGEWGSQK